MLDINVHENKLLLAYMMKHVSAYYKVNRRDDAMLQGIGVILDREAQALEALTLQELKKC